MNHSCHIVWYKDHLKSFSHAISASQPTSLVWVLGLYSPDLFLYASTACTCLGLSKFPLVGLFYLIFHWIFGPTRKFEGSNLVICDVANGISEITSFAFPSLLCFRLVAAILRTKLTFWSCRLECHPEGWEKNKPPPTTTHTHTKKKGSEVDCQYI